MVLKENQFYCVKCRKAVSCGADTIKLTCFKNKKTGSTSALTSKCCKCGTKLVKFVAKDKTSSLRSKYGRSKKRCSKRKSRKRSGSKRRSKKRSGSKKRSKRRSC